MFTKQHPRLACLFSTLCKPTAGALCIKVVAFLSPRVDAPNSPEGALCLVSGLWRAASSCLTAVNVPVHIIEPHRLLQELSSREGTLHGQLLRAEHSLAGLCIPFPSYVLWLSVILPINWHSLTVLMRNVVPFIVKDIKLKWNLKLKVSTMLIYIREYNSSPHVCGFNYG